MVRRLVRPFGAIAFLALTACAQAIRVYPEQAAGASAAGGDSAGGESSNGGSAGTTSAGGASATGGGGAVAGKGGASAFGAGGTGGTGASGGGSAAGNGASGGAGMSAGGSMSSACAHDTCTEGGPLVVGCDPCVAVTCSHAPQCCSTKWDFYCISQLDAFCDFYMCPPP